MAVEKKIKEDPPELSSKVDKVAAHAKEAEKEAPAKVEAFKEVPELSPDVAALMEQNRMLMEKIDKLTANPEDEVVAKNSGKPVLDQKRPIAYQRKEGAAWKEQDGHKFSYKDEYIGEVEK